MKNLERGFSMIEVVMSMGLMSIVLSGMATVYIDQLHHNTHTELRTGAINAAEQRLDDLRQQDPASLPNSGSSTATIDAGKRSYSVVTTYCAPATYCSANSRYIDIKASYNGQLLYEVETVFTKLR